MCQRPIALLWPQARIHRSETDFFVNVDFVEHVALAAMVDEYGKSTIIGAGRYVVTQPGTAELAFATIDEYQGQGVEQRCCGISY